jgi:hypothetical protein
MRASARSGSSATSGVGGSSSRGVTVSERDGGRAVRAGTGGGALLIFSGSRGGGGGGAARRAGVLVLLLVDGSVTTKVTCRPGERVRRRRMTMKV